MIQVLIVDDEIHCAEGVKCTMDWEKLGVMQIFTAYSLKQAQKVFQQQQIHIILCDVEMPKGSGLELLQWVREHGYRPVSILLTSYATFQYAKQAIELECMDYLLKPASREALMEVLYRAVERVKEQWKKEENTQLASYWNANEKKRVQRFWREVLEKEIPPDSTAILDQAREEHLVFHENNRYLPILFKIFDVNYGENRKDLMETIMRKMQSGIWGAMEETVTAFAADHFLVIAGFAEKGQEQKLECSCGEFISECKKELGVSIACYMGELRESGDLAFQYQALLREEKNNVMERSGVFFLHAGREKFTYQRPDIEQWTDFFSKGAYEAAIHDIERYLDTMVHERKVNREMLEHLFQDFIQDIYIAIRESGVQAHLLFQDDESADLFKNATISVRNFKKWAIYIIQKAGSYVEMVERTDSVVSRLEKYIRNHLGEELSRNQLAEYVYLSPDYLARMFRQEKGVSLSNYITLERLEKGKRLLRETNMTVGDIAYQVGYGNLAYFTKVFREKNGVTPAQFRNGI